ncbi:MAG: zinc-dependent peptidase [Chitinophagaceae bacterium]|jgi:Mlc titration factor MtfA (ptsG expression regulator)|nr:zinc-dependent peptidase [Chitinophagaceae bacterium]
MPDSFYLVEEGRKVPFDSLPAEMRELITENRYTIPETPPRSDYGWTPFVVVMTSVIALAVIGVKRAWKIKGTTLLANGGDKRSTEIERINGKLSGYHVYHGRDIIVADEQFEKILGKRCAYYRRLAPELKEKFLRRVKDFMRSKTFLIRGDEPFVDMPVLLSATAVQLSFGLDKYLLPHYDYIRIFPEEYFAADQSLRVLAGHVYGNTITIAWNKFLQGHEETNDGVNLGLHEMAHAFYFQLTEATFGRCDEFAASFETVIKEGEEVFQLKDHRPSELFTRNAYRNLQEFWAESVELFFERPADLKRENGDVYEALKNILKQDPVHGLYPVIPNS